MQNEDEHVSVEPRPWFRKLAVASLGLLIVLGSMFVFVGRITNCARLGGVLTMSDAAMAEATKPTLNVVMLGVTQAGKSALVERLLRDTGTLTQVDGDSVYKNTWLHTAVAPPLSTGKWKVTLLDVSAAPGADIRELKEAATVADVGICVVPAVEGWHYGLVTGGVSTKAGFDKFTGEIEGTTGMTRFQTQIAKIMGVKQLIVAVTHMDNTNHTAPTAWDEAIFKNIREDVKKMLKAMGYGGQTAIVPVSSRFGDNIVTPSEHMPWFEGWEMASSGSPTARGKTLMEAIDAVPGIPRNGELFMRVKGGGAGGPHLAHIERGEVSVGQTVKLCPSGSQATVSTLETPSGSLDSAGRGDLVMVSLTTTADLSLGAIVYNEAHQCTKIDSFEAMVVMMRRRRFLGCRPKFYYNCMTLTIDLGFQAVPCEWKLLSSKRFGKSGDEIKNPVYIDDKDVAMVRMYPKQPIDIEDIGARFMVSDKGSFKDYGNNYETKFFDDVSGMGTVKEINPAGDDGTIGFCPSNNTCLDNDRPDCYAYFNGKPHGIYGHLVVSCFDF
jgi:translation elongation factor EF-1alpha